jgi:hypothetical protein
MSTPRWAAGYSCPTTSRSCTSPRTGSTDVRVLSPVDLAVSKLSRYADPDRDDIKALARAGLLDPKGLRQRAEEALIGYIGRVDDVRISIDQASRMVEEVIRPRRPKKR